jgi:hypothetical protein
VDRSASFDILVVGGGRIGWMRIVCSGQRPQPDSGESPEALVSPPVAPALDVIARSLAEIGRADDDDL